MRKSQFFLATAALFLTLNSATAHSEVKNPAVAARMHAMEMISKSSKILGNMARGRSDFDAAAAQKAASEVADFAAQIDELFATKEDDPESEARSTIWDNFDDFAAIAADLEKAALMAAQATTQNELKSFV